METLFVAFACPEFSGFAPFRFPPSKRLSGHPLLSRAYLSSTWGQFYESVSAVTYTTKILGQIQVCKEDFLQRLGAPWSIENVAGKSSDKYDRHQVGAYPTKNYK
jgi:hypothetical protein